MLYVRLHSAPSDCSSVTDAGVPAEEDTEHYLTWQ